MGKESLLSPLPRVNEYDRRGLFSRIPNGPGAAPRQRARAVEPQKTIDEVQNALEELRVKELKAIRTSIAVAQEGKASAGSRETLRAEIDDIRKAVRANLENIDALERVNQASRDRILGLEQLVRELHRQLDEKEETITALEERTRELTRTAEGLRGTVKEREQAVEQSPHECVLTVKDPARFWKFSRQLIVVLPD